MDNRELKLPKCKKRKEWTTIAGDVNVCLGNEPYSCERMLREFGCPLGKKVMK